MRAEAHRLALALACVVALGGGARSQQNCANSAPACFQALGFLPGGTYSAAFGVSRDGAWVVEEARNASGAIEAFRRSVWASIRPP